MPSLPLVFGATPSSSSSSAMATTNPHRTQQESDAYSTLLASPSQQQHQQQSDIYSNFSAQLPMQLATDNSHTSPSKDVQPSLMQQPYSGAFSFLTSYQDVPMPDQSRYSPSSFLSLTQDQEKRENRPLLDIQQAGNFALKCEPSIEDQLTAEDRSSRDGVYYQNVGQPGPGGSFQQTELARGGSGEELYDTQQQQQQQKMLGDGALECVLNQFYQHDASSQQDSGLNVPRSLSSQHPQARSLGGSFRFPPTAAVSPLTSPPPHLPTDQQRATQHRSAAPSLAPFVRVSSAGNLPACTDMSRTPMRPPLERGKSEPIKHLQEKVRSLNAQQMKQMEELDKQKTIAEVQYSEILMQLLPYQQVKPEPSDQQQQVLQRVLSDPSLVKILRSVLLSSQPNQQQAAANSPPLIAPARPHIQPRKGSASATPPPAQAQMYGQHVRSPDLVSPTQLSMVT